MYVCMYMFDKHKKMKAKSQTSLHIISFLSTVDLVHNIFRRLPSKNLILAQQQSQNPKAKVTKSVNQAASSQARTSTRKNQLKLHTLYVFTFNIILYYIIFICFIISM